MSLIQKPEPLIIAGKPIYSLTSYDPVEVELLVPTVTEEEIDLSIQNMLKSEGGSEADLNNPDWLEEHVGGVKSQDELRARIRSNMQALNMQTVEERKMELCVKALAERLGQSVPQTFIDAYANSLEARFAQDAQQANMSPDEYIAAMGMSQEVFKQLMQDQARELAEHEAALSAFASEKKIKVEDDEIAPLMGVRPQDAQAFMDDAKKAGFIEELRVTAVNTKAAQQLVSECSCTFKHESAEEAKDRVDFMKRLIAAQEKADKKD